VVAARMLKNSERYERRGGRKYIGKFNLTKYCSLKSKKKRRETSVYIAECRRQTMMLGKLSKLKLGRMEEDGE
jgi:hypothetical protein